MVLDAPDVVAVAEHLKNTKLTQKPIWLIGTLGLELRRLKSWRSVYKGGAFVEPHMPELREFKNFFLSSLKVHTSLDIVQIYHLCLQQPGPGLSALTEEYMMENTGCVARSSPGSGRPEGEGRAVSCGNIQRQEMELRFQQDPQVNI